MLFASAQRSVPRSARQVEAALREQPDRWLARIVEEAGQADVASLQRLALPGVGLGRFPLREEVAVGSALLLGRALLLPLDWSSSSPNAIFPAGEVDLEAANEEASGTRIELRARLTAPGPRSGGGPHRDQRRVAQAFVQLLADRIEAQLLTHASASV